ncbi:hypothetical protein D041_0433B, partial [Vibrio parahaemolyticus EKP-008]
SCDHITQDL